MAVTEFLSKKSQKMRWRHSSRLIYNISDKELEEYDPKELIKELFKAIEMTIEVITFVVDAAIEPILYLIIVNYSFMCCKV